MPRFLVRHAKTISVVAGFVLGVIGTAWSFIVVDRLGEAMRQLSDTKADLTQQVQSLNSIASEYFIANQQGDLIFILALQDSARQEVASLIYKGNMLDRGTPVRNMIGALAIAKQLDYRQTYDAYEKLNDEARANLSFANFTQLKQAEQVVIAKGQARVPLLQNSLFEVEKAMNANGAAQKRSRVIGFISSIFGSFLLLLANLIAQSRAPD
ncbi:hypothetical protein [Dokdonella soli]|uniref:Chemotaxis methyl-accepting receptor HlyB-like 4HB MCP domain-containing protein n=2 Tax=Dokdonella soli TaxID=529810 RepID=A0ABN1IR75_9GAMM